jgi:hypothetical protein
MTHWRLFGSGLVCAVAIAGLGPRAAARTYTVDSSRSHATIAVGKSGAFSFAAGHTHEVAVSAIARLLRRQPGWIGDGHGPCASRSSAPRLS